MIRKIIAQVAFVFAVNSAFAQDLTSKKGEPILPEAGDWAISVDATPFFNYAGNFFGKSNFGTQTTTTNSVTGVTTSTSNMYGNQAPLLNFLNNNQIIVGKYFKDAKTAYRIGLRLGFGNKTDKKNVNDIIFANSGTSANQFPNSPATVENKHKQSKTNVGVTLGIEKRRGKTRLQGFYGVDAGIWFGSSKDKYTYGNALAATSSASTTVDVNIADGFGDDMDASVAGTQYANVYDATTGSAIYNFPTFNGGTQPTMARITQMKSGLTVSIGARAFIGAEYFVAPKVSIGGEFGWGLGLSFIGKSKTTWESIGTAGTSGATQTVGTTEVLGGKSSSVGLDNDGNNGVFGPSASLRLNFHF